MMWGGQQQQQAQAYWQQPQARMPGAHQGAQGWAPQGAIKPMVPFGQQAHATIRPMVAPTMVKTQQGMRPTVSATHASKNRPELRHSNSDYLVYSTAPADTIGLETLAGEYKEAGANHGVKYFKKLDKINGIDVFLYYWDESDGADFSGWWFGNQVGGSNVWSRNSQKTSLPPTTGWQVPWDGAIRPEVMVVDCAELRLVAAAAKGPVNSSLIASKMEVTTTAEAWDERVNKATERAAGVELDANETIDVVNEVLEAQLSSDGAIDHASVKEAQMRLRTITTTLADSQRFLATEGLAAQKAPAELKHEMVALGQRVRKLQATVKDLAGQLARVSVLRAERATKAAKQAEDEVKNMELEGQQRKQFEEMVRTALEKLTAAEEEIEKVMIAAAPLQADIEDAIQMQPMMMEALKETEKCVHASQASLGEVGRFISGKLTLVQRWVPEMKKAATAELTELKARLQESQATLDPYRNKRQNYQERLASQSFMQELNEKVAGVEIEVEKVVMVASSINEDNEDGIQETESSLTAAQSGLSQTSRSIQAKLKVYEIKKGAVFEDLKGLADRIKESQLKLEEIRTTLKEQQVRSSSQSLLREVSDKVVSAEDELSSLEEIEIPFTKKGGDSAKIAADTEQMTERVQASLTSGQTLIAKKLLEVSRSTGADGKGIREELGLLRKRLEEAKTRLQQLKTRAAERKRGEIIKELEAQITQAEHDVKTMTEATSSLKIAGESEDISAEKMAATIEQAAASERTAQAALVEVRKVLLLKTGELKKTAIASSGFGAELGKLQTRVNAMQQDISDLRTASRDAEERVRAKQMLAEVEMRLQVTQNEVEKVVVAAAPVDDRVWTADDVATFDKGITSITTKLNATAKLIDVKLRSARGFLKTELDRMRKQLTEMEKTINSVSSAGEQQRQRFEVQRMGEEARGKVEKANASVKKMEDAEAPFLTGVEGADADDVLSCVKDCETAASAAQVAIADAKSFIERAQRGAKNLATAHSKVGEAQLVELRASLDVGAAKVADVQSSSVDRRRRGQMQASKGKIVTVEELVKKLTSILGKFEQSEKAATPEEVGSICEEMMEVEKKAQEALGSAREFLAQSLKEIQGFGEEHRETMIAELTALQSRLTQSQMNVAKHSRQCTEREQRYVARRLVLETTETLAKMQADVVLAEEVKPSLDDAASVVDSLWWQSLISALQSYMTKSGSTVADVFAKVTAAKSFKLDEFRAFVEKISELTGKGGMFFTEERVSTFFECFSKGKAEVSLEQFQSEFPKCYVCAVSTSLANADGGEVGTVEVDEAIKVLNVIENGNNTSADCVLLRNGSPARTTLKDSDGCIYFEPCPLPSKVESVMALVTGICTRVTAAADMVEQKAEELLALKSNPFVEARKELLLLRPKFKDQQIKIEEVKRHVAKASKAIESLRAEKIQKTQETRFQAFAAKTLKEATDAVTSAEAKASKATESAKPADGDKKVELAVVKGLADDALKALADAKAVVARILKSYDDIKGTSRSFLLQSRVELTKLATRASTSERKCAAATEAVRTAHEQQVKSAILQASTALRTSLRKSGQNITELFSKLAKKGDVISEAEFVKFVNSLPDHGLSKEQVSLVFQEFGKEGLKKIGFARMVQEFCTCAKVVTITDAFDIGQATTLRKLTVGELFEVLEGPLDDADGMSRVKGRAVRDGVAGWVSMKNNQGTSFLKAAEKPYMTCTTEVPLRAKLDLSSTILGQANLLSSKEAVLRQVKKDEVLELLEGPRELTAAPEVLVQGRAGIYEGWITAKTVAGETIAAPSQEIYVCKAVIAMTDIKDIKTCKPVAKIAVGHTLKVIGGNDDKEAEITRLKFRAMHSGKEGWVSLKGNQGTAYLEISKSHYVLQQSTQLRAGPEADSALVRKLEVGEAFEAMAPPKEVTQDAQIGVLARAESDGEAGWVMFSSKGACPLRPCTPK